MRDTRAVDTAEGTLTMRPLKGAPSTSGLKLGSTSGTLPSPRKAELASTTQAPAAWAAGGQRARGGRRGGQQRQVHAPEGLGGGLLHRQRVLAVVQLHRLGALGGQHRELLGGDALIQERGEHLAAHHPRGPHHGDPYVLVHGASLYASPASRASLLGPPGPWDAPLNGK